MITAPFTIYILLHNPCVVNAKYTAIAENGYYASMSAQNIVGFAE